MTDECWCAGFVFCFSSQCAMAALNDVRQYLSVEGGQVAVSPWPLSTAAITVVLIKSCFSCCFRSLTPQTQPEREGGPLSSLRNRMASRCWLASRTRFCRSASSLTLLLCLYRCFSWSLCVRTQMLLRKIYLWVWCSYFQNKSGGSGEPHMLIMW